MSARNLPQTLAMEIEKAHTVYMALTATEIRHSLTISCQPTLRNDDGTLRQEVVQGWLDSFIQGDFTVRQLHNACTKLDIPEVEAQLTNAIHNFVNSHYYGTEG